jgi:YVTN family beta-propeller protein
MSIKKVCYGILITVAFALGFSSCERQPEITPIYPPVISPKGGLYILNEGIFQTGGASLDYYDFESQQLSLNAFETKNKRPLGDVLQSICMYGSTAYLVVNNSKKIEVIDARSLESKHIIEGFKSPRYMAIANPQKAYVSEYYSGGIRVVDIQSNAITSTIPLAGNCDELMLIGAKLYVTNALSRYLYVINTNSDVVMDSIEVGYGPNSLALDAGNKLWVLCSGRKTPVSEKGALVKIDPRTDTIEARFTTSRQSEHGPIKLRINGPKNTLYWINKNICRHRISDTEFSEQPWLFAIENANNFWALRCDSATDEIYVGDAVDYVQRSVINRYDESGGLRGSFKAGIITGDFYFNYLQ